MKAIRAGAIYFRFGLDRFLVIVVFRKMKRFAVCGMIERANSVTYSYGRFVIAVSSTIWLRVARSLVPLLVIVQAIIICGT